MVNLNALNPFTPSTHATSEITDLRIYPIKSCRGISVKSSTLTLSGLDLDRNWMFMDRSANNTFQTIRQVSKLTLVRTSLASSLHPEANGSEDDLELVISIDGTDKSARIPARPTKKWLTENTTLEEVEIWGTRTDGWVYGDAVSSVFTELVGKPISLVYKGPTARVALGNAAKGYMGRETNVNFPDVLPVQIASEASLAELNSRLKGAGEEEITIERFRPNIIVKGGEEGGMPAWSEDDWKMVRVANGETEPGMIYGERDRGLEIDVVMRCARCQVPNVNPDTAEKHKKQPWDILVSYRRVDEGIKFKPCFGMLCAPKHEGPIRVGMKFEVVEKTNKHKYMKAF